MKRNALTADADCKICKGTGIRKFRELAPGAIRRYGGNNPMVTRRVLCSSVEARPQAPK